MIKYLKLGLLSLLSLAGLYFAFKGEDLGQLVLHLADVDLIDPVTGDEHQSFDHAQAAWTWKVVHLNLAVFAVQTQHPDLTGSGDCIRERGIHRGIGFKSFREVATSRFDQLLSVQRLNIQRRQQ